MVFNMPHLLSLIELVERGYVSLYFANCRSSCFLSKILAAKEASILRNRLFPVSRRILARSRSDILEALRTFPLLGFRIKQIEMT